MKTTNKLSKKNILIALLLLVILSLALSNTDERKLIDKLNDDEVLIDKFIDFSTDGYERKINLSKINGVGYRYCNDLFRNSK